jgi:hypothetical protein
VLEASGLQEQRNIVSIPQMPQRLQAQSSSFMK